MSRPDGAAMAAADDDVRLEDALAAAEEAAKAEEAGGGEEPGPDDLVEVEYEGRTYALPAALRGALMRHADYTRKTQALAEHRQEVEAARRAVAEMAEAHGEHLGEVARLVALEDQISRLSQLDWPALHKQNPGQAEQLMTQLFHLKQAHEIAAGRLQHRQAVKAFDRQRERARRIEEGRAALAREIDGWSPELAHKLAQYALGQGISPEELEELSDPRLVKILHHACAGCEAEQQRAAADRLAQAQRVRPAIEVGGSGGGPKDPNRMSTDDWMRHRRGQLRGRTR